jgi:SAM-dependent methyltransferase
VDLSRQLFHLVTAKNPAPPPPIGEDRGAAADEASDSQWIGRMGGRLDFAGKSVLDVGCSGGTMCVRAARAGASSVTGVDLEVDHARRFLAAQAADVADRVEYVQTQGDLTELAGRTFDLVISKDSMEHYPEPERFIDLIVGLVRPGGELAIGFSPLWKSPKGGHIDFMTKLPWAHLLFSERTIMAERVRFRPEDPAESFATVRGGLNKMTLRRFDAIMSHTGLEPVFRATDPGERRVLRVMRQIARIPLLREYFTVGIYTIWRKPEGAL